MEKISVITVTSNRKKSLHRYIKSVICADEFTNLELIFLINGQDPAAESLLKEYSQKYNNIRFVKAGRQNRGKARNTLVGYARGEIMYFLDDDVIVAKNTFSVMLESMKRYPDVDIIGGPNLTPPGSSLFQVAQGVVLGNFFGTLWMSKRYESSGKSVLANERSLILSNLAFRREVFEKSNIFFSESIVCAEENLLLQKLMDVGYKAMYVPELIVYHERRKEYSGFCRQIFTYGRGRAQAIFQRPVGGNIVYFTPALFVVYLTMLCWRSFAITGIPLYVYSMFTIIAAGVIAFKNGPGMFWFGVVLFPTVHLAYGTGFVVEVFKRAMRGLWIFFVRREKQDNL
ncbi:MAG: glycosyltransferase [Candidatus Omnitrophica bacterium]|nr:glycosyltransferase [Candidatus Omnitrophota bacterium]